MRGINKKALVAGAAIAAMAGPALAGHAWSTYHWQRTTDQISPPVHDNVDSRWQKYYEMAVADWNKSTVIESGMAPGTVSPKRCPQVSGTIQVCNERYGRNGWLGLASISISGGHIVSGTTKVNDSYYTAGSIYDADANGDGIKEWMAAVMCQEIGHDYGLGHQDENQNDDRTNSCMEYTNNPVGNEHPDFHDYDQLLLIYNHMESAATAVFGGRGAGLGADTGDTPREWGRAIGQDAQGRPNRFMRQTGANSFIITHVTWAIGEGPRGSGGHH